MPACARAVSAEAAPRGERQNSYRAGMDMCIAGMPLNVEYETDSRLLQEPELVRSTEHELEVESRKELIRF